MIITHGVGSLNNKSIDSAEVIKLLMEKENKIKALERQIEDLKLLTKTDSLTGVLNKRAGMELLDKAIRNCEDKSSKITIVFLDIDNFKEVNDTYGHVEGDRLLQKLAKLIEGTIRKTDSVFRCGGDEFVIVFSEGNLKKVRKVCNRMTNRIKAYNKTGILPYKIGVSYGIAQYNNNLYNTPKELIDMADREMYKHKKKKKENG